MGYQETYIAKEQTRMGHDLLVITANRYGRRPGAILGTREALAGFSEEDGIKVLRLPILFELPTNWAYPWLRNLIAAVQDFSPDIVHCHGILSFSNIRAAISKKKLGYGLVVDNHTSFLNVFNPDETWLKRALKKIVYKGTAQTFGRILARQADSLVAIGEPEKEFAKWLFGPIAPKDIPIIRLGADHVRFRYIPEARKRIRHEMGWSSDQIILGHAGTISSNKGIDTLLEALVQLPKKQKGRICVHLVGKISEGYLPRLETHSAELGLETNLFFTQFIPPEDLSMMMSAWDVAVWAGDITNTALEAMAVGRPLITSRSPYTEYIIEQYKGGMLIGRNDIGALSKAISVLIEDEALRLQMGKNARYTIEHDLNWEKISAEFIKLYEKID
jgi:glycosyltransferase involved in cell wall biosynthesis